MEFLQCIQSSLSNARQEWKGLEWDPCSFISVVEKKLLKLSSLTSIFDVHHNMECNIFHTKMRISYNLLYLCNIFLECNKSTYNYGTFKLKPLLSIESQWFVSAETLLSHVSQVLCRPLRRSCYHTTFISTTSWLCPLVVYASCILSFLTNLTKISPSGFDLTSYNEIRNITLSSERTFFLQSLALAFLH